MMNRRTGKAIVIIGIFILSLQIYGLKLIQALEKAGGEWFPNAWMYLQEDTVQVSFIINVVMIGVGICLLFHKDKGKKN